MTHSLPSHPGPVGRPVHLDHNATIPIDPRVTAAMPPHATADLTVDGTSLQIRRPLEPYGVGRPLLLARSNALAASGPRCPSRVCIP
ncbi:hypothetical protein [Streptomyces triticisoli]|jgi:hypothetical protein|uniref:hypothetical protein n=1 Tax=Streptomyces triticisoli TaxID=2182797 RepID=UPI000DD6F845|nr:hypothetical protein [Streptomyces triticisoli]